MAYSTKEQTRSQVLTGDSQDGKLQAETATSGAAWRRKVRTMRRQPTVKLARELCIAPILASEWSIKTKDGAPDRAQEFIAENVLPLRIHLLRSSLFGCIDWGWQGYEKIFELDPVLRLLRIKKIKPLLQDITEILVEKETGAFAGFEQSVNEPSVALPLQDSLLVNIDVEGTYWYGEGAMRSVEYAYDNWKLCNDSNVRYDKKLAGAHWIIYYPVGKTPYNGVDTENDEIAKSLLNSMESSGCIAVPNSVEDWVNNQTDGGGNKKWEIELKSAYPTSNVAFIDRLKYTDAMMVRAVGLPERAVLEGQFGTKAEAEAHADFAITNMELRHAIIIQVYNWHLVNHLLRMNYGKESENSVYIEPAPITDLKLQYIREVYKVFLSNQTHIDSEAERVDMQAMRDQLGVPTISDTQKVAEDEKDAMNIALSFFQEVYE